MEAIREGILTTLKRDGFCICPRLLPDLTTAQIADKLGKIVEIPDLLPASGIGAVQTLVPRSVNDVAQNQYSGNYGFEEFPLHTDLAHWACPPRYFILRCIVGSESVFTHLLPWTEILNFVGTSTLGRAVFTIRKKRDGYSGLLRAMSNQGGVDLFRWDPIFLRPFNVHAQQLRTAISNPVLLNKIRKTLLEHPGDTIIIDNWRTLHGRARVSPEGIERRIERIYLSEVVE